MPLFGKKEFQPLDIPNDVKPESEVFYLPTTNEVFLDYDAYFERIVHLNSSVWTCSVTGKPGLTFDEARECEEHALKQIEEFPALLQRVVLYTIYRFCGRTRLEDLVNDIFIFMKDRYFIGEELRMKNGVCVRVLEVYYAEPSTSQSERRSGNPAKTATTDGKLKSAAPVVPPPDHYYYKVKLANKNPSSSNHSDEEEMNNSGLVTEEQNGSTSGTIHNDVKASKLMRDRHIVTKVMLKLIIKHCIEMGALKLEVKEPYKSNMSLESMSWEQVFGGPLPLFPQTVRAVPFKTSREKRPSLAGDTLANKEKSKENSEEKAAKASAAENAKKEKAAKRQRQINQQQEELAPLIATAEKCGVEDIDRWRQNIVLLSEEDIQQLKEEIKDAKELEKKRALEKRKKEREELLEWKKPRDDLQCDDLKPLPKYEEFWLPDWVPKELYWDFLSIHNFFYAFSELITGSHKCPFTLNTIAIAITSREADNEDLVSILKMLLAIRSECADEDDGDEADVDNAEEIGYVFNCDMDHKQYGNLIREKSRKHEALRNTFGSSVRHLPITSMTITEVVRLTLETSGYYASGNLKVRQQARGTIKCYDDEAFQFVLRNTQLMDKLKTESIFELSSKHRVSIVNVFIQQLLSYMKFREVIDERINSVSELRRDLRVSREFDRTQDREAREAHMAKEAKNGNDEEEKKPSKMLQKLRSYLKYLNEGCNNRFFNDADVKQTLLEPIPYEEMDVHEIEEFRELQRRIIREKQLSYLQKIFDLQARMGQIFLGKDRAFRSYYFFHYFNLFIIEDPLFEDIEMSCNEPTPLGHDFDDKDSDMEDKERIERLACTGKANNCPVHNPDGCSTADLRRWYYFVEEDGIDHLLDALNLRGFRELELTDNILFLKELFNEKMTKLVSKADKPDFLRRHLELSVDLNDTEEYINNKDAIEMTMRSLFRQMLLDTEEKLFSKGIGVVECTAENRDEWRRCLEIDGDTTHLCPNNYLSMFNGDGILLDADKLKHLSSVQKLAVAFLQVVNGIDIHCISDPFSGGHKKTKELLPTKLFFSWQQELLNCTSVSQLSLFLTTFSKSIRWRTVTRCGACKKHIENRTKCVVQCQGCTKFFHISCTEIDSKKSQNKRFLRSWLCTICAVVGDQSEEESVIDQNEQGTDEELTTQKLEYDDHAEPSRRNGGKTSSDDDDMEDESPSSNDEGENDDDYCVGGTSRQAIRISARAEPRSSGGTRSRPLKFDNVSSTSSSQSGKKNFKETLANGHIQSETNGDIGGRKRRAAAKRFVDYVYADDRSATEESGSESPSSFGHVKVRKVGQHNLRPKKTNTSSKNSESFNYRHVSMGLRESDDQRRIQLKSCEAVIRNAMAKSFGDPFAFPVDAKYVPHYYDVIKSPMDMRTMINKLKNFHYDAAEELWADCRLMFDNCEEFNEEGTSIRKDAEELEQFLRPKFEEIIGHSLE